MYTVLYILYLHSTYPDPHDSYLPLLVLIISKLNSICDQNRRPDQKTAFYLGQPVVQRVTYDTHRIRFKQQRGSGHTRIDLCSLNSGYRTIEARNKSSYNVASLCCELLYKPIRELHSESQNRSAKSSSTSPSCRAVQVFTLPQITYETSCLWLLVEECTGGMRGTWKRRERGRLFQICCNATVWDRSAESACLF